MTATKVSLIGSKPVATSNPLPVGQIGLKWGLGAVLATSREGARLAAAPRSAAGGGRP
jgi:hypothetical protein